MKDCYMSQPEKQRLISNTMNEVFRLRKLIDVIKDGPESECFESTWVMGNWCETFNHFTISKQELIRQTEAHIKHIELEAKKLLQ